jgi:toxin ParE1/3/4
MPKFQISIEAEAEIDSIAEYTKATWGERQTEAYLTKLESGFELLAHSPLIGRSCDSIHPELRRFEIEKHVVFYVPVEFGILIVRVLHQRMLPSKSRFDALG